MSIFQRFGPGLLVTAAFIGPGTVTSASQAGANFGFALLWAVLFSIIATMVLQEMAARLGLVGERGLGEAIRSSFRDVQTRRIAIGFVILAIGFGNAAYQTGNLTGAATGLEALLHWGDRTLWSLILGILAFILLLTGTYKIIERVLIALVVLMSLTFLLTAVLARPNFADLFRGLFIPSIPKGALSSVIALIGTTVVPYNLFLHADTVRQKWGNEPTSESLANARRDTVLSISVGGLITLAIVITAASTFYVRGMSVTKLADFADQLAPTLGQSGARLAFALGLLAAGLTSAITAPLASAYAICGAMSWKKDLRAAEFRAVWITILLIGIALASTLGSSPRETIFIAQVANGLLLPIIAVFLLMAVNRTELMGPYKNGRLSNVLGIGVVLIASGLGIWKIIGQIQKLF